MGFFRLITYFFVAMSLLGSAALAQQRYSDYDLDRVVRGATRDECVEWHHRLVDRFNRLLNTIAAHRKLPSIKNKNRPTTKVPRELGQAKKILSRSMLIGTLVNRNLSPAALADVRDQLSEAQKLLERTEATWLRWNHLSEPQAERELIKHCSDTAQDEAEPISDDRTNLLELITEKCQTEPRVAISGEILTYDGMKEPDAKDKRRLVSVKNVAETEPAPVAAATPAPVAMPDLKPPKNTPPKTKVAKIPEKPGIKPVHPELSKDRAQILYDGVRALAPWQKGDPLPVDFARFLLATENTSDEEYRKALAHWEKTKAKYAKELSGIATPEDKIKKLLTISNRDFWGDYYRGESWLTRTLNGAGGNCEARSKLIPALVQALGIELPKGKHLLLQNFSGHIQPVIYDEIKNQLWDLLAGTVETGTFTELYDPALLINATAESFDPKWSRNAKDFLVVGANKTPPKDHQVGFGSSQEIHTNTMLKLPASTVIYDTGPIPEHTKNSAPAEQLKTVENNLAGSAPTTQASSSRLADADLALSLKPDAVGLTLPMPFRGPDGEKVVINHDEYMAFSIGKNGATALEQRCNDQTGCLTSIMFVNRDDFEKAKGLTNYRDLFSFALQRELEYFKKDDALKTSLGAIANFGTKRSAVSKPNYFDEYRVSDRVNQMVKDLGLWSAASGKAGADMGDLIKSNMPELGQAIARQKEMWRELSTNPKPILEQLAKRGESQDFRWYLTDLDKVAALEHGNKLEQADSATAAFYKKITDPRFVAYTAADAKKRVNRPSKQPVAPSMPSVPPTPSPHPTPSPTPLAEERHGAYAYRGIFDPEPIPTAEPEPKPEPELLVTVPKRPINFKDPEQVTYLLDLALGGNFLSPQSKENMRVLWTETFSRELFKSEQKTYTFDQPQVTEKQKAVANDLIYGFPSSDNTTHVELWPELERCQIYSLHYSLYPNNGNSDLREFGCKPQRLAEMELMWLKLLLKRGLVKPTQPFMMRVGGHNRSISATELEQIIEAQISGGKLPDWFVEAREKARQSGARDYPKDEDFGK